MNKPSSHEPATPFELYPWQRECLQCWRSNRFKGIVNVITGAGKTFLALAACAYLNSCLAGEPESGKLRVRIVVPSVPLAHQWRREVKTLLPSLGVSDISCGLYYGGHKENPEQDYTIYVLNSARYAVARHILSDLKKGEHILLIVDECHRCASSENRKIFDFLKDSAAAKNLPHYHALGLSATPRTRDYDTVLVPALGKEIYRYPFTAAIRDGYISSFSIYQIGLSFTAAELQEYGDLSDKMSSTFRQLAKEHPGLAGLEKNRLFAALQSIAADEGEDSLAALYLNLSYKRKSVSCMAASRSACALDLIERLEPHKKILIFGERIQQAQQLYQMLSARYPGRVGRYHSQMSAEARQNTLESYRNGSLRILVSCRGLDEGINVPEASVGIVLSGSSADRQRIQRLGRLLRRSEGKSACLYYLHIRESSEDGAYLANPDDSFPVCELFYSMQEHDFCHPAYEEAAVQLLDEAARRNLTQAQQKELRICILEGLVRPDWLAEPHLCSENMTRAQNRRERNYWICMKRLSLFRRGGA